MNVEIYQELRARYEASEDVPPTEFPNEEFTRPSTLWARFHAVVDEERQVDIGSNPRMFRTLGLLTLQLFGPLGEGPVPTASVAGALAAHFRAWKGETVQCYAATVKEIGNTGDGWYQMNIVVPFKQDVFHYTGG